MDESSNNFNIMMIFCTERSKMAYHKTTLDVVEVRGMQYEKWQPRIRRIESDTNRSHNFKDFILLILV
ncbi:unnamed protein product [Litomosoides sigmodontis]|uniref:Uncharacterized protein n=1 Tax=Litomosoides sigmodontis TaxID=42156 RepID=A0A3P6SAZ7_LITSI|nr:unnamed protein product [Litomosoides sigmodontis]